MKYLRNLSLISLLQSLMLFCSVLPALLGLATLTGWLLGVPDIVSFGKDHTPMSPSSALFFILFAVAAFLHARYPSNRKLHNLGLTLVLVCGITALVLFILSFQGMLLEIEHLGFPLQHAPSQIPIGHMKSLTAACFLSASLSYLILLFSPRGSRRADLACGLACLVMFGGGLLLLSYIFGIPLLYNSSFIPPSALSCAAFTALGIALVGLSLPHTRLMIHYADDSSVREGFVYILIFIVLAAAILITGYRSYSNFESEFRAQVGGQISSIAELKVEGLLNWRNERVADAGLIYRNTVFSGFVERYLHNPQDLVAKKQIHGWLAAYEDSTQYDRVSLMNAEGLTLISVPNDLLPPSASVLQMLPTAKRTHEVTFVDFYKGEGNQGTRLALLIPVLDAETSEQIIGFVALRIDPTKYLYRYISQWPTASQTAENLLIRRDQNEVVFLSPLRFNSNAALTLRFPLSNRNLPAVRAVLGYSGVAEGMDYRGEQVLADTRHVLHSPWYLVTKMDIAELSGQLQARLWQTLALISMAILFSGAGLAAIWRQQRINFYRAQAESAEVLRVSEERFRALVENSGDALTLIGADGSILYEDATVKRLTGYAPEDRVGRSGLDNVYPADLEMVKSIFGKVLSMPHSSVNVQFRSVRKDGTVWWTDGTATNMLHNPAVRAIVINYRDVTERMQAEEQLRASEKMLRQAQSVARLGSYVLDMQTGVWQSSQMLDSLFGIDAAYQRSVEGWVGLIHPTDRAMMADYFTHEVLGKGLRFDKEYRVARHNDQAMLWVHGLGDLEFNAQGQPVKMAGTIQDITTRKHAEEAIKKSEEKFSKAFKASPEAITIASMQDGRYVEVNDIFLKLTGFTRDEVIGHTSIDLNVWVKAEDRQRLIEEITKSGYLKDFEVQYRMGNGTVRDFLVSSEIIELEGEACSLNFMLDITERKQTELEILHHLSELKVLYENGLALSALREPREIGKQIVETLANNMSWHHIAIRLRREETDDLDLIAFNQPRLVEKNAAEIEKRLNMLVSKVGQGLSGWSVQTGQALRTGNVREHPQYVDTYPGIRSGLYVPLKIGDRIIGSIAVESEEADAFTEQDERLLITLAAQTSITFENARLYQDLQQELRERRRAELEVLAVNAALERRVEERTRQIIEMQDQLVRQERLATLGQIAGSVSHELRNPLGVISNAVYFLKAAQPHANEKIKEYLAIIENETRTSNKIVTDLLDFTRIKSMDRRAIPVAHVVHKMLERYPAPSSTQVTLDLPNDLPQIYADPQHVVQILGNIALNAYQAMTDHDGMLSITAEARNDKMCIKVCDTGVGISPENLSKLFEPLFTTKTKGIGLGLAVSQKLAEANGGRIEVQSEVGKGSIFTLWLPVHSTPNGED